MSKNWNNCTLISEEGEFNENFTMSAMYSWQSYCNTIGRDPKENVWYDHDVKKCFGSEQTFFANPDDFSFFNTKEEFVTGPHWGDDHVKKRFANHMGHERTVTDEYIIQNNGLFEKYKGKNILMVGGGPSCVDIAWEKMDIDYDHIWTCNNFYKNDKLVNLPIDLVTLGPTVDLSDDKLLKKVKADNITCAFEGGISPFRSGEELTQFSQDNPGQVGYFHLRYFSKLGGIARLICLGALLEANKIYIVGCDGYPVGAKHAFEGADKKHSASHYNSYSYDLHKRHYVLLWDYVLNLHNSKTKFQNLGEGHEFNQMTDISKKEFPLILK
jgi:hypothetical protein